MKTSEKSRSFLKCQDKERGFTNVCRLCLSSSNDRKNIFDVSDEVSLPMKIMACASIEVCESDGLPSEICLNCVTQLDAFFKFRLRCQEVNYKLRDINRKREGQQPPITISESQEDRRCEGSIGLLNEEAERASFDSLSAEYLSENGNTVLILSPCGVNNKFQDSTRKLEGQESRMTILEPQEDTRCEVSVGLADEEAERAATLDSLSAEFLSASISSVLSPCDELVDNASVIASGTTDLSETNIFAMEGLDYNTENSVSPSSCFTELGIENRLSSVNFDMGDILVGESQTLSETFSPFNNCDGIGADVCNLPYCLLHNETENSNNSQIQNSPSPSLFKCEKCLKSFSKKMDLKRHSSVHDEQRGFECSVCEKWFPKRTDFKRHERVHTGERPFDCPYCMKSFSQKSILSRHLMMHRGERPFKCELCSRTFGQKHYLEVHISRHLNTHAQKFPCRFCRKEFCHQSGLTRHLLAHTGKRYHCMICYRSFSDQSSLKRHSETHGGSSKKDKEILL